MKKKQIYLYLLFSLSFGYGCKAQLMQSFNDAYKIRENRNYYVNKPFKRLLKDIKPTIVAYSAIPDPTATKIAGLYLYFISVKEHRSKVAVANKHQIALPATIAVRFKTADISMIDSIIRRRSGDWRKGLADSLSNFLVMDVSSFGTN